MKPPLEKIEYCQCHNKTAYLIKFTRVEPLRRCIICGKLVKNPKRYRAGY